MWTAPIRLNECVLCELHQLCEREPTYVEETKRPPILVIVGSVLGCICRVNWVYAATFEHKAVSLESPKKHMQEQLLFGSIYSAALYAAS